MTFLDQFESKALLAEARKYRPRVKRWVGVKSTNSVRRYICYITEIDIDTESAKHASTKHAENAIRAHFHDMIAALMPDEWPEDEKFSLVGADWLQDHDYDDLAEYVRATLTPQTCQA